MKHTEVFLKCTFGQNENIWVLSMRLTGHFQPRLSLYWRITLNRQFARSEVLSFILDTESLIAIMGN